ARAPVSTARRGVEEGVDLAVCLDRTVEQVCRRPARQFGFLHAAQLAPTAVYVEAARVVDNDDALDGGVDQLLQEMRIVVPRLAIDEHGAQAESEHSHHHDSEDHRET